MPLQNAFDRRLRGPECPVCSHQPMTRLDTLARYPVFRCDACGTAIAEFALPSFAARPARTLDPRDPPVAGVFPRRRTG